MRVVDRVVRDFKKRNHDLRMAVDAQDATADASPPRKRNAATQP
jgi:hypothetical protein